MNDNDKPIIDRINRLMNEQKISITKLSQYTDIPRTTVASWFDRSTPPKARQLSVVAECLGTTTDYLLNGTEPLCYALNKEENQLIESMRSLSPSSRKLVYDLVYNLKNHILG